MKWQKITFAVFLALLAVFLLVVECFATVPTGVSGVNFANISEGTTPIEVTYINGGNRETVTDTVQYRQAEGGFIEQITPRTITGGMEIRVTIKPRNDDVLKWTQSGQTYYGNARLMLRDGETEVRADCSVLTIYTPTGETISSGAGPYGLTLTSDYPVGSITFTFGIPANANIVATTISVSEILLLQENPIYDIYYNTLHQVTEYVPYNSMWFEGFGGSYDEGYEAGLTEGYQQGATEASGGAIQRWGAFLFTAVDGVLSFEIIPGFPLWGLLGVCVAFPLLIAFLKFFAGG